MTVRGKASAAAGCIVLFFAGVNAFSSSKSSGKGCWFASLPGTVGESRYKPAMPACSLCERDVGHSIAVDSDISECESLARIDSVRPRSTVCSTQCACWSVP